MIAKVLVKVRGFPEEGIYGGQMEIDFACMGISRKFSFMSVVCSNNTLTHSVFRDGEIFFRASNGVPFFGEHYGTERYSGTKLLAARIMAIINSSISDFAGKVSGQAIKEDSALEFGHALLIDDEAQCEVLSLMCARGSAKEVLKKE